MPLDALLAALAREAQAEADRLLSAAREAAAAERAATDDMLARERERALASHERLQRERLEAELAEARSRARQAVLEARHALIERVLSAMRVGCRDAAELSAYRAALPLRLAAARSCFGDEADLVLAAPRALLAVLRPSVADDPRITTEDDPSIGAGFRLATETGTVEVLDTLEARLLARHTDLARRALVHLGVAS